MKVLLLGATGPTGRALLKKLLAAGHDVTAFARTPAKIPEPPQEKLRVVQGDALDAAAVEAAVAGQEAVVSCLGSTPSAPILSQAAKNVVEAMKKHGVRRLVWLSAAGVGETAKTYRKGLFWRVAVPLLGRKLFADREVEAKLVAGSGLDWTLVHPTQLTNKPGRGAWRVDAGEGPVVPARIARADVADFMLKQLSDTTYAHKSPAIGG